MIDLSKLDAEQLVSLALVRRRAMLEAETELGLVNAELILRGAGQYVGTAAGEKLTVVAAVEPGTKIVELEDGEKADEVRAICGESFRVLFERVVTFAPKSGFLDRAAALFKTPERKKLLSLVGQTTKGKAAYVLYPKEAK